MTGTSELVYPYQDIFHEAAERGFDACAGPFQFYSRFFTLSILPEF
jgi:hypothetical protein